MVQGGGGGGMEFTGNNSVIKKKIAMRDSDAIKWSFGRHLG
jgi:hypothetical protein